MLKKTFYPKIIIACFTCLFITSCSKDNNADVDTGINKTDNQKTLGTSASDFLSSASFSSMQIEIGYVEGYRPTDATITNLLNFFENRINKPNGVSLKETIVPATSVGSLSTDEVVKIENDNRTVYNTGDELAVWVFFADENSEKNEGNSVILGTAYRNTSCIIYEKTIKDISSSSSANLTLVESTTIMHEFGHLFGLVNGGSDMQEDHEDTENERHCITKNCLMYYQTVNDVFSMTGLSSIPKLDDFCLADLKANGGK
ncbi:MAG: membrane metalloprotease [Leeuwenhoekiella sp.]